MRRLGPSLALAVFAGAWAVVWAVLPTIPYSKLPEGVRSTTYEIFALPGTVLNKKLQLPWDDVFIAPLLVLAVAFAIASMLLTGTISRLDPRRTSWEAMRWLPRTLPCLVAWCVVFVGCLLVAAWLDSTPEPIGSLGWILPAAFLVSMPFVCLRGDVIAAKTVPLLWLPRWPRSLAVALLFLALLATLLFSALQAVLDTAWPAAAGLVMLACWISGWLADLLISLPAIQAWQQRARWQSLPCILSLALRREHLFPAAASDLRLAWIMCFLIAPPLLFCALHAVFVLPQAWQDIQITSVPMPEQLRMLSTVASWVTGWVGLALVIPTSWLVSTARARTLHLTMEQFGMNADTLK